MKNFFMFVLAVALVLGGFEWYRVRQVEKLIPAAHIAQGLALAAGVKNHVAAYYGEQGRLPSSNEELDLPAPGRFAAQALTGLAVSEGGVITLTFNALAGVNHGRIQLIPDTNDPVLGLNWRCVSPSFRDIGVWAPRCRYEP